MNHHIIVFLSRLQKYFSIAHRELVTSGISAITVTNYQAKGRECSLMSHFSPNPRTNKQTNSNCKSRNTFLRACRETERRRFFFDTQNSSRSEWQLFPSSIHAVIPTIRFVPRHNGVLDFMKLKGVPHLCDFH